MPKLVDIAAHKQMIAEAAIRVIEKTGLERTRLRDVALAGNVTIGNVTHYFDSRDSVLAAAFAEVVRRTLERIDESIKVGGGNDFSAFVGRVCNYLPIDDESRGEWRIWMAFLGRAIMDEQLRIMHRDYYQVFVERITDRLQMLDDAPQRPKQARQLADALISAIDGIGTRATLEPDDWPAKRQIDTLTALLTPMLESFCKK